ncbi:MULTISPECIES: hypothetical protein [unclassified Leifsonia]|uniref:hypothetical protein n=1 Tax=unclassified Leifsonia TaxID=2663824 RepID=UPI0008A79437|nr:MULTISPECIES: hypothetical protein [unclassified Leifsonia]SEH96785.1 hypothetical protein SAMN04515694_10833 [Leifsonia sp. CL154]SFL63991.1 hypothetical protein SAMN04515692_108103 [Leifsonia sp. CL147]
MVAAKYLTAESVAFQFAQVTENVPETTPGGRPHPFVMSGPNRNRWSELYDMKGAKVGHTYRHGPVVIRVLGTWQSSKSADDKRGYLHVSFDEGEIVCPPLPAETVEVAGQ